jgi:tetratricopeptide (TPR) repeat protein
MRSHLAVTAAWLFWLISAAIAQTPADRQRARTQYRLGWESMRAEAWAEAARAFRRAIDIDPTFEYGYYGLGRAQIALKQFVEAIAALEKCRDLYRADAGRQFSSAQEAQRYRRDRILEIDEQIRQLQTGPQTRQTQDLLRQFQNTRREMQQRVDRGNSITIQASVPAFVSLSLGSAYFRAGRLADAEREYKATIEADPKSGEAFSNLAVVYLETGRLDEAQAALTAAKKAGFQVNTQLEQEIKRRRGSGRSGVVDLGALQFPAEVDVDRFPLRKHVERGVAGFAVPVSRRLDSTKGEVDLGADGRCIQVEDPRFHLAHGAEATVDVLRVERG